MKELFFEGIEKAKRNQDLPLNYNSKKIPLGMFLFKDFTKSITNLLSDNATRWNSTFTMLNLFIE